jgi:hypothetical protein
VREDDHPDLSGGMVGLDVVQVLLQKPHGGGA